MNVGKWIVSGLIVLASLGSPALADDKPASEEVWQGIISAGGVDLTIVLNLKKAADGTVTATMDCPDQGAKAIKVETAALDATQLLVELPDLQAKFDGKLNADKTEAKGDWKQGPNSTPMTFRKKSAEDLAKAKIVGKEQVFEGKLALPGGLGLRLVIHVNKTAGGTFIGTFDSPDQGANGLKIDTISIDGETLKFSMKLLKASYEGKLNKEKTEAVGEFKQAGAKFPLTLKLVEKASETRRPQTPKPPFSYTSENVSYPNKTGGVSLAGTLTIPKGAGPFPVVLMISGSGAQDRDETILGHRPFLVIADALANRGIAVLRVDDRGVGGSTGNTAQSTSADFAGDVLAGVSFLKTHKAIDPKKIGLIGHSEGGIIAPMVAAQSNDVAFIILMAGTGLPGDAILKMQARLIHTALGTKGDELEKALAAQAKLVEIVKTEKDDTIASKKMKTVIDDAKEQATEEERKTLEASGTMLDTQLASLRSPWFRYFLTYDPRPMLTKVKCPVLALIGEEDLQVPPDENLAEIEKALKSAGNTRFQVKQLPGLNHLFQTCKTGSPAEYAGIEETIAPSALKIMGDWIVEQTRK